MTQDFHKPVDVALGSKSQPGEHAPTMCQQVGSVILVGAGPGDPELLTLKAIRALQNADIILFDHLVSDEILDLARKEAKRMLVGKRARQPSCRQDDINEMMVKLAKQGKRVVRLKSGDPMIFGRAGEEIDVLQAQNIPVTVVPGVTAANAMAASLKVSLTHRDHAHSVRYVTGHSRDGCVPDNLDWKGLADPETTLVFYMGGKTAPRIAERLIDEGLSKSTPVVIVANISRRNELRWEGIVEHLLGVHESDLNDLLSNGAPVLIGIGNVLRHAACQNRILIQNSRDHDRLVATV